MLISKSEGSIHLDVAILKGEIVGPDVVRLVRWLGDGYGNRDFDMMSPEGERWINCRITELRGEKEPVTARVRWVSSEPAPS